MVATSYFYTLILPEVVREGVSEAMELVRGEIEQGIPMFKVVMVFEGGETHDAITTSVFVAICVSALDAVAARELASVVVNRGSNSLGNGASWASSARNTLHTIVRHRGKS